MLPSSAASGVAARKVLRYRHIRERVKPRSRRRTESEMATPTSVDDYLSALPEDQRVALERLRKTIRVAAPQATEKISYAMPAFEEEGRFLVSYAAFKDHCSLYPASTAVMEALGDVLKPYFSGKGTLRFRVDDPIPTALVTKIVRVRLQENAARKPSG